MDGRDIGSVVFPEAELKLFMTADVEKRAQRRQLELLAKGENVPLEEIKLNLESRDQIDSSRS
jgi:cytidylate kinase